MTEVIAGRVDYYFCADRRLRSPISHDGRLLASRYSPMRASTMPDVTTTLEAGYPDLDYTFWIGVFAERAGGDRRKLNSGTCRSGGVQAPARQGQAGCAWASRPIAASRPQPSVLRPKERDLRDIATFAKAAGAYKPTLIDGYTASGKLPDSRPVIDGSLFRASGRLAGVKSRSWSRSRRTPSPADC